jgi:hypothetical protein
MAELSNILAAGVGIDIDDDGTNMTVSMTGMVVVTHGATADTARPAGAAAVYWIGSVEPTNAVNGDIWYDTTGD